LGHQLCYTQQIANLRTQGKDAQIHDIIISGVIFELVTGALLSLIFFVAQPLSAVLSTQNPADAANLSIYISIMSLSIFAGALLSAASGVFIGFERMKLNSLTQILQAIVKTALGPLLIVLGFGVLGAIYTASISFIAGSAFAILLVYFTIFKPPRKFKNGKCDVAQTLKPMLRYGLPLTVSNIVIGRLALNIFF
jgi:O-antigen/teichoic acid export membrane protein